MQTAVRDNFRFNETSSFRGLSLSLCIYSSLSGILNRYPLLFVMMIENVDSRYDRPGPVEETVNGEDHKAVN